MKKLWEKLAKKNSKYYINTDYGKEITEDQFRESGQEDCIKYINKDDLLRCHKVLLEIGCGNGRMTEFIKEAFTVLATDISGKMIEEARERVPGVYFAETDGYTLPFDDNSIDIVFSYIVFQHFKTKEMVESNFQEVLRVLKPGGIFKVRIRTDKVKMDQWWSGVSYTEQTIGNLIKETGYELIRTEAVKDYGLWLWLKK